MIAASIERLAPFGAVVRLADGTAFGDVPVEDLHAWVREHRVVVLRGLRAPERMALPLDARRLGPLQAWTFGSIHELEVKPDTNNYLYTDRAVPLHWDGAFAGEAPRYLVFHCLEAPAKGGETEFVDTSRVWSKLDEAERDRFRALSFRYSTEKKAHYGGTFTSPLVVEHETRGDAVLRFAEPVDDLNAVRVEAVGLDPLASAEVIGRVRRALRDPDAILAHPWAAGDVVIADNLGLLHGRRAFPRGGDGRVEPRRIRRVNVLRERTRSPLATLRDALRIRRPEFMVAEIPILLIPMLLSRRSIGAVDGIEIATLFFLLFHVGDMVNCLADRAVDAVYKTHLSEAVFALGPRSVTAQIAGSCAAALGIAAERSLRTERWEPIALVAAGLALGLSYSLRPLWLKGRGLLQIPTLWAVIFVGPMTLVWVSSGRALEPLPIALFAAYGLMQQGIVLVNTAEDIPEDRAAGIRTSAIALGLEGSLVGALLMILVGGAVSLGLFAWMLRDRGAPVVVSLLAFAAAIALR
ncbi:MAG: TauD/TfdA family dioxygenase [Polyangiaceae bacterium]